MTNFAMSPKKCFFLFVENILPGVRTQALCLVSENISTPTTPSFLENFVKTGLSLKCAYILYGVHFSALQLALI